jgi:pimeloyl-ACP methyl ester carboxylesterase
MKRSLLITGAVLLATAAVAAAAAADRSSGAGRASIAWKPCHDATLECGAIRVPVDWSKPAGAKLTVRMVRRPADDPSRRIGTLFFQPGGPGDGGISYVADAGDAIFAPAVRARFDIVGVDPRGYGESTPVSCGVPLTVPGGTLFPRTPQAFQQLVQHNRAVGASCLKETGGLLGHVDAESVARDHEAIRAALGEPKISFLSISYDSQVAAVYAQLYPSHVRAMAIDAVLEHDLSDTLATAGEVSTVESSFDRFAAWCRTAPSCVLKGQNVGRFYDRLVKRADRTPIAVEGAARPVTGEDIRLGTQQLLLFKNPVLFGPELSWGGLARALKAAAAGHAAGFAVPASQSHTDRAYSELAVLCGDYPTSIQTFAEMQRRIQLGRQLAPHLQGASQAWGLVRCIGWPVKAANPRRHLHVHGTPPILIVNATHDPSTSYAWAQGLAEQIDGSVLLTRIGDGHTSYFSSPCARAVIDRYLITGDVPAGQPVCR